MEKMEKMEVVRTGTHVKLRYLDNVTRGLYDLDSIGIVEQPYDPLMDTYFVKWVSLGRSSVHNSYELKRAYPKRKTKKVTKKITPTLDFNELDISLKMVEHEIKETENKLKNLRKERNHYAKKMGKDVI